MLWIDRFEKLGRLVLWLVIAMVLVVILVAYANQRQAEAELRESLQKARAELVEMSKPDAKKPTRLAFASMGVFMSALNLSNATGQLWFTNVSPRVGFVCVRGVATNPTTQKTSQSLPACQEVGAYASTVRMTVMFAGGELANVCQKSQCDLRVEDVPATDAEKVEASTIPPSLHVPVSVP
jgi:hypothetical protein